MESQKKKLWFRAKYYGWGWYPCSWEGWIMLFIWAIVFVSSILMMDHEWLKNLLIIFLTTFLLIYICYKTGEKPRWRF